MLRFDPINNNQSGFTLAFAVVAAAAGVIMIIGVARLFQRSSHELNYVEATERSFVLAETGLNTAISQLIYNSRLCSDTDVTFTAIHAYPETGPGEEFKNTCFRRAIPQNSDSFFIITSATVTANGKSFSQTLYSYVGIANVAEYFAAVNGDLQISFPTDISEGKVYAQGLLTFDWDSTNSPPNTFLDKAEFYGSLNPAFNNNGNTNWNSTYTDPIKIADITNSNSPIQLANPLLFPQVTPNDQAWYLSLATLTGNHTVVSNFATAADPLWTDIYPPGYDDFNCLGAGGCPAANTSQNKSGDKYLGHTKDNREHVYYYDGDIHIGKQGSTTTIHGQVLFVATGKIVIDGNVRSVWNPLDTYMPGAGVASSSTAHQAVFIPGPTFNVDISSSFYVGPGVETEYLEGLFLVPSGTINVVPYPDPDIHSRLGLQFTGAMILGKQPDFRSVFTAPGGRTYSYMTSLKSNAPPYLPSLSIIYNEFPDITSQTGLFN